MSKKSPQIDAYIAKAAEFARPILEKMRALVHKAHPDIEETMKWAVPHFDYKGIVAGMAAFKQHVSFGFWKANLMSDPQGLLQGVNNTSVGGMRIESLDDLPPDKVFINYVKVAVGLNEAGVKTPRAKPLKKELKVPDYFLVALKKNRKALATFESFSPSHKREYVDWITEAKQETTRQKRMATALEWLAEGKSRNWKYQK